MAEQEGIIFPTRFRHFSSSLKFSKVPNYEKFSRFLAQLETRWITHLNVNGIPVMKELNFFFFFYNADKYKETNVLLLCGITIGASMVISNTVIMTKGVYFSRCFFSAFLEISRRKILYLDILCVSAIGIWCKWLKVVEGN